MVSSVKEKDITKLWEDGYLAKEIAHRLPAKGQIIPTQKPHERVVFIPHFVCGLGFPLHPFVRGLMFYYGLDFHDLAPNSFQTLQRFYGTTHEDIWKVLFKGKETRPETTEDRGHALAHPASAVSISRFRAHTLLA